MSGRSAYVRKKTDKVSTQRAGGLRSRASSTTSSDNSTLSKVPTGPALHHDRRRERNILEEEVATYNHGSAISSLDGARDRSHTPHPHRPPNDVANSRPMRPTVRTEDISGIEKSGLRSALDKKSDEVRKGLAKAFMFKKDKRRNDAEAPIDSRPESAATVRPGQSAGQDLPDRHKPAVHFAQYPSISQDLVGTVPSPSLMPPTAPESTMPPVKRWMGGGKPVQRWSKLRKDPELWDPNGDVLVFFGHQEDSSQLDPSLRLSSHLIEATESRYLITLLREGYTEEDPPALLSPASPSPMLQRQLSPGNFGHRGRSTPSDSDRSGSWDMDGQISYRLYFPAPSNMSNLETLRYHITTRNVFATLQHASLVGFSLCQALTDLSVRLDAYLSPEVDTVGAIIALISARGIDDVRNDAETAVSLLAWSEGREVRWEEGWREMFLHCAGMHSQLESCDDFKHVTPITRALLERASLEMQLRVQSAEERLATFQYGDIWPAAVAIAASTSGPVATSPAKAAADHLRQFFLQHYTRGFGQWPPPAAQDLPILSADREEGIWLTRTVAQLLQRDFAALYDYLVNRDVIWDESEARPSRKWMMVSESGNRGFEADTPDLPMTDMLIEFDNKHRFPHIPHPYPLVPDSVPHVSAGPESAGNATMFSGKLSKKNGGGGTSGPNGRAGSAERRIQLAYTEATNICILGSDFTHSSLVDAFTKFEKTDRIGDVDPSTARRGRWVLIYGVLQTLASVSVDAPTVRYRDGVPYHLSPRLKGVKLPPWKTSGQSRSNQHYEATHELSHCWTVAATWHAGGDTTNSEAETSSNEDGGGGGGGGGGFSPVSYGAPSGSRHGRRGSYLLMPSIITTSTGGQRRWGGGGGNQSVRSATSSRAPSMVGSTAHSSAYTASTAPSTGLFSSSTSAASVMSYSGSDTGSSVRPPSSPVGPWPGQGQGVGMGAGGERERDTSRPPPTNFSRARGQQQYHHNHHQQHHQGVLSPFDEKEQEWDDDTKAGTGAGVHHHQQHQHQQHHPGKMGYVHGPLPQPPPGTGTTTTKLGERRGGARRGEEQRYGGGGGARGAGLDDFLDEEEVDVDGESFAMLGGYGGGGRSEKRLPARGGAAAAERRSGAAAAERRSGAAGTEAEDAGPVIRDFDELGIDIAQQRTLSPSMFFAIMFIFWRIAEILTLIPIMGMLAYFVNIHLESNTMTPTYILLLFIVSVIALAWSLFTLFSYHRSSRNAQFVAILDLAFVGAFIAGVYYLRFITRADCASLDTSTAYLDFGLLGSVTVVNGWDIGVDRTCAMLKACFALGIMNVVFFFFTSVLACIHGDRAVKEERRYVETRRSTTSRHHSRSRSGHRSHSGHRHGGGGSRRSSHSHHRAYV
ncbi:hypothetical protein N658DRAFT_509872 [Parathielavia hyrcaniae]|uniref:DUF8004 domain-containing protein n=1 Tax=Parathielavia hyrcaniae TaxID=113614 RepID=A0AAN6PUM4_9PEZI|nr:hypothetical protein N658DRAFT_509872 [Parathielavia hyrcaniae]